jgi:hypothetical protein
MKIEIPDEDVTRLVKELRGAASGMNFFPASRDRILELADYMEEVQECGQAEPSEGLDT